MSQFPNIPDSVKKDIRKRAEDRYPLLNNDERDEAVSHWNRLVISQREGYYDALYEAWEMMESVWHKSKEATLNNSVTTGLIYHAGIEKAKTEFLNQIFKE